MIQRERACKSLHSLAIPVGDLMKSMQLLLYNSDQKKLELRARDYSPAWMCAVTFLDNDIYLGAENNYNLYTVRKNDDAVAEEDRCRLQIVGQYHLGDFVNKFRQGSLVMRLPDSELSTIPTVLYGAISGAIGVIASISAQHFEVLTRLQDAMRKVVKGVGGFSHSEFRSFSSPFTRSSLESKGFVDGDLIEQVLDLKKESLDAVFAELKSTSTEREATMRLVEELARLH